MSYSDIKFESGIKFIYVRLTCCVDRIYVIKKT